MAACVRELEINKAPERANLQCMGCIFSPSATQEFKRFEHPTRTRDTTPDSYNEIIEENEQAVACSFERAPIGA